MRANGLSLKILQYFHKDYGKTASEYLEEIVRLLIGIGDRDVRTD
jgi:hypothetical protein